jgi:hypothetical protein
LNRISDHRLQQANTAVLAKVADMGRWKSSKIWSATSATLLYSPEVQVHPEPVHIAPRSGGPTERGSWPAGTGGRCGLASDSHLESFGAGLATSKSKTTEIHRIFGVLKFLYLEANTGAEAEVEGG